MGGFYSAETGIKHIVGSKVMQLANVGFGTINFSSSQFLIEKLLLPPYVLDGIEIIDDSLAECAARQAVPNTRVSGCSAACPRLLGVD